MTAGEPPYGQAAITRAWSQLAPRRGAEMTLRRGFTAARMERILQVAFAAGSLLLGTQAFLTITGSDLHPLPRTVLTFSVIAALALVVLCCLIGRFARGACGFFAVLFPIVQLLLWPLPRPDWEPTGGSWMYLLLNVAGAAPVIAFPLFWQLVWVLLVPGIYALMRLTRGGFTAEVWVSVGYEMSLALIIGGTVIAIAWMLRNLATGVDDARAAAVAEYTRAVAVEATERERVEVAALMHDSVLAALIAAERADSERERQLAVAMAREALTRLANAESDAPEGSDEPVTPAGIGAEIAAQARALGASPPIEVDTEDGAGMIPGRVARALALAATQAIANAVQHADGAGLAVRILGRRGDDGRPAIEVVVSDEGDGVDLDAVPADRLGIRASILARVAAVGGLATVRSGAGEDGTTVRLVWPDRTRRAEGWAS